LALDLKDNASTGANATIARRLAYVDASARSLVMGTARKIRSASPSPDWKTVMIQADPAWGEVRNWQLLKHAAGPITPFFLLYALDLRQDASGHILAAPPEQSLFIDVLLRTFAIAALVTCLTLLLGFPVAYLAANWNSPLASVLLALVLIPFWTPLLVRTAGWLVMLQDNGVINQFLLSIGAVSQPMKLIYNRFGVVVSMTHVLLPFMILPIYSVMKTVPKHLQQAALSLGASPTTAFVRVYLPQVKPGITAGALLVFILALGYYITPALLGGQSDQMLSSFIAFYVSGTANWGLAAALGLILLVSTLILYAIYQRLTMSRIHVRA